MEQKKSHIQRIARLIIQYFREKEQSGTRQEIDELWDQITYKVEQERIAARRRTIYLSISSAAAIALCVIWYANRQNTIHPTESAIIDVLSQLEKPATTENILLVMPGDKKIQVESDSKVAYSKNGAITINSETIDSKEKTKDSPDANDEYNQLIVPKGKRTQLLLSDGSKLWVNSGTHVVYPRHFNKERREIFVEGEVYLDVFHDESAPFFVKTKEFEVQVLGTSFNVRAYKEEESATVVLVNGVVNVKDNHQTKSRLEPNQLIAISSSGLGKKETVNTYKYTSWTDGLILLESEPITDVFKKLNLYYGSDIEFDESLHDIPISGKLDLKENIENVIQLISKTAPISYYKQDNRIIIQRKTMH